MSKQSWVYVLTAAMAACILAGGVWAQEMTAHKVTDQIYMLEGRGGNIGVLIGEDGVLIIDDQFANMADAIRGAIADLGQTPPEPKFVLNTHHHGDHTGGNEIFGTGASIIAHKNVRGRLLENTKKPGLPVITFDESLTVHFNGETLRMLHLPAGHTDGDSVIFFEKANVLHMGDLFFSGRFPFIDPNSGGDVKGFIKNVTSVRGMVDENTKIIPGHGALSTKKDLDAFHAMLIECSGLVKRAIASGKSLDDIKAAGMPARYKDWGAAFISEERWIDILYAGLSE